MNSNLRLRVASLSLLGSLAAAGCSSSKDRPSEASHPLAPADPTALPEGSGGSAMTIGASPDNSDGIITAAGLVRPVASTENSGATCDVMAGAMSKYEDLPNPFARHDGTLLSAKTDWECRRNEIKKDIEQFEIGAKPDPALTTFKLAPS